MERKSSDLKLEFIKEKYIAGLVAVTGSNEFMLKDNSLHVGIYDESSGCFIPLRKKKLGISKGSLCTRRWSS